MAAAWHIGLPAQAQTSDEPRFEAASIRVSKAPAPGGDISITPGRFRGEDLTLQWLILTDRRINSKFLSGNLPEFCLHSLPCRRRSSPSEWVNHVIAKNQPDRGSHALQSLTNWPGVMLESKVIMLFLSKYNVPDV